MRVWVREMPLVILVPWSIACSASVDMVLVVTLVITATCYLLRCCFKIHRKPSFGDVEEHVASKSTREFTSTGGGSMIQIVSPSMPARLALFAKALVTGVKSFFYCDPEAASAIDASLAFARLLFSPCLPFCAIPH
jgi:hypothetical protein